MGQLNGRWVTHDVRDEVVEIRGPLERADGTSATRLVKWIGVGISKFYDWRKRLAK